MKITKRQLQRIIREAIGPDIPDVMGAMGGGKFQPRATSMGHTAASDDLFGAQENLLALIEELLNDNEYHAYIDSLIRELEAMKKSR